MKVLVTGSAGFLGRHIVALLSSRGYQVLGLDRSPQGARSSEQSVPCDILDAPLLSGYFRSFEPEAVIHLAARTDLQGRSVEDYPANTQGVANVVSAIRQTPSLSRAIFTSSQLVCRLGYVPRDDTDYRPSSPYGQSKVETERIVREGRGGGVTWCLVRPTTVWGPGMSVHYQRFLRMVARGSYVHVGSRPVRKTYGYIGNVAHQYVSLLEAPAEQIQGRTLYLGDYEPLLLKSWADGFARAFDAPPVRTIPRVAGQAAALVGDLFNVLGWKTFPFNSFRLANVLTESVCDLSRTKEVCGPLPYTQEEGIEETARWFRIGEPDNGKRQAASPSSP